MLVFTRGLVCAALALTTVSAAGSAQRLVPVTKHKVGVYGALLLPSGQFQRFVDWGGGLGLYFVPGLTWGGTLGLRIDGSALWYGHESFDVWLGPRMPYDYARVSTDNLIAAFGIGPQFTIGSGPVRPYGFGTIGGSYFATVSHSGTSEYAASSTNFDDWSLALAAGGGLLVEISRRHNPVWLDLSAQWTHNGVTDYLREGSIVETADGGLRVYPIRSEANHWSFRLGVAVGL